MRKLARKRPAFTLVEILIVLILLGILAGALMLVSFSATSKAEATRIVEDMRCMKAAAMLFNADYGTWPIWMKKPDGTYIEMSGKALPDKYLEKLPKAPDYWIGVAHDASKVAIVLDASSLDALVRQRLQTMVPEIPLCGSTAREDFGENQYAMEDYALWYIKKP